MTNDGILEELGVHGLVNACGTLTVLGGTTLDDEILGAIREAGKVFLDVPELHVKAGNYVARLLGAEDAYVTSGGAAGIALSVGACMTRGDTTKMVRLPITERMPNEVIVQRLHRNMYDRNIEVVGGKIVEVGSEKGTSAVELEQALTERTAAVVYFVFDPQEGVLPLKRVLDISHRHGTPVIVDAAAELPPVSNLVHFVRMGADLVVFSGGKDLGAPNDTGLVLGKKNLIQVCRRLGPHSYETADGGTIVHIGRPMKVSKEDIVAVVVAVKRYLSTDHNGRMKEWVSKADYMASQLSGSAIKARKVYPSVGHPRPASIPRVEVTVSSGHITAEWLVENLRKMSPPIYSYSINGKLYLNPQCLKEGEEEIVVSSLKALLSEQR
jgi:L-seryl-tRNA(Ser) seleniumtransferase